MRPRCFCSWVIVACCASSVFYRFSSPIYELSSDKTVSLLPALSSLKNHRPCLCRKQNDCIKSVVLKVWQVNQFGNPKNFRGFAGKFDGGKLFRFVSRNTIKCTLFSFYYYFRVHLNMPTACFKIYL